MIHLRIIAPRPESDAAIELIRRCPSSTNLIVYRDAAIEPHGDVLSCDVADEEASYVIADLKHLGIPEVGTIDIEHLDASVSSTARAAEAHSQGSSADAVIWENVAAKIADQGFISAGLVALFSLAGMIASVAILIDSAPIVVGAMAVSPDFGPIAAFSVGTVRRRPDIAFRGLAALIAGFTAAIVAAFLVTLLLKLTGVAPAHFVRAGNTLAQSIAAPDWYSVVVALCAGAAGMLSVTLGKSAALVGVAISITTIPAAADIGLSTAYRDWDSWLGSSKQLALNILGLLAGDDDHARRSALGLRAPDAPPPRRPRHGPGPSGTRGRGLRVRPRPRVSRLRGR